MPSRLLTNLAALATISVRKPLAAAGFVTQPCGWRRVTEIGLRSVGSKFTLSTFGLESGYVGGDFASTTELLRRRLADFLSDESGSRMRVIERDDCCVGMPVTDNTPCFTLRVEPTPNGILRFDPSDLCCDEHAGECLLNFVCRVSPDLRGVDVWMQVHHAAADGAPMQELLGRLKQAWGTREEVTFPTPEHWRPRSSAVPWHRPADRPIVHALDFLNFSPLLECRRRINARRAEKGAASATVGAVLVWCLSRQPGFESKKFAITVDVPATAREPRCVDLVVTRPAAFKHVDAYVDDFNAQIPACRERRSPTRRAMQTIALLQPRSALSLLRLNAERTRETFGTVGVSLLRDAEVFLAPMSDPGFDDGFLAVGRMDLPTAGAGRVGAASAKGDRGKPDRLLAALRDALDPDLCNNLVE